jgi:hypothetical protein
VLGVFAIAILLRNYRDDYFRRQGIRQALFDELQPVALANCELERFGESHDGGYLMCGNLLGSVAVAYSFGIGGYDGWGCQISRRLSVRVHQYDCFDLRRPACPGGDSQFHEECVGSPRVDEGRTFRALAEQITGNGDQRKRLAVKMDVEGAEWESLETTAPEVLDSIEQLAIEFHGTDADRFLRVVRTLKQSFYIAHLHFNNSICYDDQSPFPTVAYEVLFVNKRIGEPDSSRRPVLPHRLDAPNDPTKQDCQPVSY